MDTKDRNGLMLGYIRRRPWGPHHLVDIFGKLHKGELAEPPYRPSNDGVIRVPYSHRGFQPPPPNLGYNRENIDQGQHIYRSDATMEPWFSYILGNSNEDIWRPEELNIRPSLGQRRAEKPRQRGIGLFRIRLQDIVYECRQYRRHNIPRKDSSRRLELDQDR